MPDQLIQARWGSGAIAPIEAAQSWKDKCLLEDGSVFSDKRLWTADNVAFLDKYFVQNLSFGEGNFFTKLEAQLEPAPAEAKQLAAEMFWVLYLIVRNESMTPETKRIQIQRVWEWSGEKMPQPEFEYNTALSLGIANPGQGYNTNRWREFLFFIQMLGAFKALAPSRRRELLNDSWAMGEWIDGLDASKGRQFRHVLLFLLFPNEYDPIVTGRHKREIVRSFRQVFGDDPDDFDYDDRIGVDREILRIHEKIPQQYGSGAVNFYAEPLREVWKKEASEVVGSNIVDDLKDWYKTKFGDARVWLMGAGEAARAWPEFRRNNLIAIGWDYLGDLSEYSSREEVHAEMVKVQGEGTNPSNDSLACWQFAHDIRSGDHVIIKRGTREVLGWGIIKSEYRYEPGRAEYDHVRDVEWRRTGHWTLPADRKFAAKTLTEFSSYRDWLKHVWDLIDGDKPSPDKNPMPQGEPFGVEQGSAAFFMGAETFQKILTRLARRKNIILQGPPGVGKSFIARNLAYALIGYRRPAQVGFIQFHQSYSYEDFVQGFRPDGNTFALRDGVFHRFCAKAAADPENIYVFVIDEINRGNISKILGELMLLIESDKRGPENAIPLTYSPDQLFYVPENVYLIGLMNTADRSLAILDYALRRRFGFVTLRPAFSYDGFTNELSHAGVPQELIQRIVSGMESLNERITTDVNLGPGFQIGHSFFVPSASLDSADDDWYRQIIETEIQPLLEEYWLEDTSRVTAEVKKLLA
jgi:5-methylcytosine-specific restriction enzyme B